MGTVRKRGRSWHAQVRLAGLPQETETFRDRASAWAWVLATEKRLRAGTSATPHTFREALDRYAREITPRKRGVRPEMLRLAKFARLALADQRVRDLRAEDFAQLRNEMLRTLAPGSIIRDFGLMSAVLDTCRRDWGWIETNPLRDVRRPPAPPSRTRRISDDEIRRIRLAGGWPADVRPDTGTQRVVVMFLFALETGMRQGEIATLRWPHVNLAEHWAFLPETKNGRSRHVALTPYAGRLLELLQHDFGDSVFGMTAGVVSTMFRTLRDRAEIKDLHFHDARHEAAWRLGQILGAADLARQLGHHDIREVLTYYHPSPQELAAALAAGPRPEPC